MTKHDHEVIKYTWTCKKDNSKLTDLDNDYDIRGIALNKGLIHGDLSYYLRTLRN